MSADVPLYDVVVRNGFVIDGTGRPAFAADVAIRDERIAQVGELGGACAVREIDASGLVVNMPEQKPNEYAYCLKITPA